MNDNEYCDMLRNRAILVVEKAKRSLQANPGVVPAAHVSISMIEKAAAQFDQLKALAEAARVNP